jgi:hypothetical protein
MATWAVITNLGEWESPWEVEEPGSEQDARDLFDWLKEPSNHSLQLDYVLLVQIEDSAEAIIGTKPE